MSEIELFTFRDHQVRTLLIDGVPWFLAVDVCAICALKDTSSALRRVDDRDVRRLRRSDTPQYFRGIAAQVQEITVVNESGLYDLVFQSPKPEAREFKRWVTSDLLPRYRRGELVAAQPAMIPATYAEALRLAADKADEADAERAGRIVAENEVKKLAPAAESWDRVVKASGDRAVREAAQILSRDPDIKKIGQKGLFDLLRELGWLDKKSMPYQAHVNNGRLALRMREWDDRETGETRTGYQVRVTAKGIHDLRGHLTGAKPMQLRLAIVEDGFPEEAS